MDWFFLFFTAVSRKGIAMQLSNFVLNTPPSGIRAIYNRIAEMPDVISFALGEPDFDTPAPLVEAACRAYRGGKTHYTPNAGLWELRCAIAGSYTGIHIAPKQVIVTAGATEALLLTMLATLNPGDEVIVSEPYWPTYLGQIRACGAVPVFVRTYEADGFSLKSKHVREAVTPRTRMLIINSPANPTGAIIPRAELEDLADLAQERDLLVLSDEVYRHITYGKAFTSISQLPGMAERCVIIDSFSKAFAMTGWRIGYAAAPPEIARAMESAHEYSVSCIGAPVQLAALEALRLGDTLIRPMRTEFETRRKLITDGINGIGGLHCLCPDAAFYLYFNISGTGLDADTFASSLLEQQRVAVSPGTAFGSGQEQYIRLSYANSRENLTEGLRRIRAFAAPMSNGEG